MGALLGLLAGHALARRALLRGAAGALAVTLAALSVGGAGPLRDHVNLVARLGLYGGSRGAAAAKEAYDAVEDGRIDDAIRGYERAIALRADEPSYWYNVAIAYESKGALDKAVAAFDEATRIDPGEGAIERRATPSAAGWGPSSTTSRIVAPRSRGWKTARDEPGDRSWRRPSRSASREGESTRARLEGGGAHYRRGTRRGDAAGTCRAFGGSAGALVNGVDEG